MAEFISTFTTGFQNVVKKDLSIRFKGIKILNLYDGLIHYQYNDNSRDLEKINYFNNTFFVLKTQKGKNLDFKNLVEAVKRENKYYLINKGSFRVRFQQENQFAKVDKKLVKTAEDTVLKNTRLISDRVSPTTEIWYSIRSEGFAFCGQLISKREFTEKNLQKGELRPEVAYFMCRFADIGETPSVIAEPFCGYGSIPVQLAKHFRFSTLFASDIDKEKIEAVSQKKQLKDNPIIKVSVEDAFSLPQIPDKSVSYVITDPPWGFYEEIEDIYLFYKKMFESFKRILAENGTMVILSARKTEIESVINSYGIILEDKVDTLVNGKKASLYRLKFSA